MEILDDRRLKEQKSIQRFYIEASEGEGCCEGHSLQLIAPIGLGVGVGQGGGEEGAAAAAAAATEVTVAVAVAVVMVIVVVVVVITVRNNKELNS